MAAGSQSGPWLDHSVSGIFLKSPSRLDRRQLETVILFPQGSSSSFSPIQLLAWRTPIPQPTSLPLLLTHIFHHVSGERHLSLPSPGEQEALGRISARTKCGSQDQTEPLCHLHNWQLGCSCQSLPPTHKGGDICLFYQPCSLITPQSFKDDKSFLALFPLSPL